MRYINIHLFRWRRIWTIQKQKDLPDWQKKKHYHEKRTRKMIVEKDMEKHIVLSQQISCDPAVEADFEYVGIQRYAVSEPSSVLVSYLKPVHWGCGKIILKSEVKLKIVKRRCQ